MAPTGSPELVTGGRLFAIAKAIESSKTSRTKWPGSAIAMIPIAMIRWAFGQ
jgi:ABC-type spermidine/putrescine transport system permease subunit I